MVRIAKREQQLMELGSQQTLNDALQLKRGSAPASAKSYERALARLGMTILSEQSSELIPYMAGFQLLDKSDEGDFAAGFFVFDINGTIVDAPIFLIDGKVKGYQLIFLREQGIFLPSEPEIVRYIMTRHDQSLGESSFGEQERRPNKTSPNFQMFSDRNRYLQKVGEYPAHFDLWSRQSGALESFLSIVNAGRTLKVADFARWKGKLPAPDWIELLEDPKIASKLASWCDNSPLLSQKVAAVLGSDWRSTVDQYYKDRWAHIRTKAASFDIGRDRGLVFDAPRPAAKLAAFSSPAGIGDVANREMLVDEYMRIGAVFFDERNGTLKKAMHVAQQDESWSSPLYSGKYSVPLITGDLEKLFVVIPSDIVRLGGKGGTLLMLDKENRRAASVESADAAASMSDYSQGVAETTTLEALASELPEFKPENCSEKEAIILVTKSGKVSEPFVVEGKSSDSMYSISPERLSVQGSRQPFGDTLPRTMSGHSYDRVDLLLMDKETRGDLRQEFLNDSSVLRVPPGTKMLKLANESDDCCYADPQTIHVMPLSSLGSEKFTKLATFDIQRVTKKLVRINNKAMLDHKAAAYLMTAGLRKEAAIDTVVSAGDKRASFMVVDEDKDISPWQVVANPKLAIARNNFQGDPDYQFSEPPSGYAGESDGQWPMPMETGVRERIPSTGMQMVDESSPPWSSENTPYSEPGFMPGGSGGAPPAELANDPAAIFENTMFPSLIADVDPATDRERLISGLLRGCDDAGRSLFLTYAHGDEFAAAYGLSDAEDLEQRLLRVITGNGKLLVQLLNRSIEDTSDMALSSLTDS